MDAVLWFVGSLAVVSLLAMLAYQNGKVISLERRVAWLERITAPSPPRSRQGPYRNPPEKHCEENCAEACRVCHEEAEAYKPMDTVDLDADLLRQQRQRQEFLRLIASAPYCLIPGCPNEGNKEICNACTCKPAPTGVPLGPKTLTG